MSTIGASVIQEDVPMQIPSSATQPKLLEDSSLSSFDGFKFEKVLAIYPRTKTAVVLGHFEKSPERSVIVKLEKTAIDENNIMHVLSDGGKCLTQIVNDMYAQYHVTSAQTSDTYQSVVISDATSKHIEKYSKQTFHIVEESPEDYLQKTLQFIEAKQFSMQWVYNILEHKAEVDRIVYEDDDAETGFILLPDLKWDGKAVEDLYLVAIAHKHGIKTLRDLNASHLPLLKKIFSKGKREINARYHLPASQLKVFIHYHPTYYHFHVHFVNVSYDESGGMLNNAVMLKEVIDNIETFGGEFYMKKTMLLLLKESHPLTSLLNATSDEVVKSFNDTDG